MSENDRRMVQWSLVIGGAVSAILMGLAVWSLLQ
jgi:hypothetical protein